MAAARHARAAKGTTAASCQRAALTALLIATLAEDSTSVDRTSYDGATADSIPASFNLADCSAFAGADRPTST